MEFELSEIQQMIRDEARNFARKEVAVRCRQWDEAERFPEDVVRALGALGMLGVMVPEEYGGPGSDPLALTAMIEEIGRYDGSLAAVAAVANGLVVEHLRRWGSAQQQQEWLGPLACGERLIGWGFADPEHSARSGNQVQASRTNDGWRLTGNLRYVQLVTVSDALMVFAQDQESGSSSGFLLPTAAPGLQCTPVQGRLGLRATGCGHLELQNVEVTEEDRLGTRGQGLLEARQTQQCGRIALAAVSVGLARGALEETVAYARERRQFGKPIADFQAIQWKIAEMGMGVEASRLLVQQASFAWWRGDNLQRVSHLARLYSADVAVRCALEAIQIHGGYGYTHEFPVERFYRDAKTLEAADEGMECQRQGLAASMVRERTEA